jgi:hypothetical protein
MPGLDPGIHCSQKILAKTMDCRVIQREDAHALLPGNDEMNAARRYCTLSATNRSSPSAFDTSSSTDFLPSFLS